MRRREGDAPAKDLISHLDAIRTAKSTVAERAPELAANAFGRMGRIEALLQAEIPDPAGSKRNSPSMPTVQTSRKNWSDLSHICYSSTRRSAARSPWEDVRVSSPEMGREVNTIGSKANDADIAALVVRMKAELEKLREQVQMWSNAGLLNGSLIYEHRPVPN